MRVLNVILFSKVKVAVCVRREMCQFTLKEMSSLCSEKMEIFVS